MANPKLCDTPGPLPLENIQLDIEESLKKALYFVLNLNFNLIALTTQCLGLTIK